MPTNITLTADTITDAQITALLEEATAAGDEKQADLCRRALGHSTLIAWTLTPYAARGYCADAINAARKAERPTKIWTRQQAIDVLEPIEHETIRVTLTDSATGTWTTERGTAFGTSSVVASGVRIPLNGDAWVVAEALMPHVHAYFVLGLELSNALIQCVNPRTNPTGFPFDDELICSFRINTRAERAADRLLPMV